MTLLDQGTEHGSQRSRAEESQWRGDDRSGTHVNVGQGERTVSVAAGALLAMLGLARRSLPGLLVAGVGAALIKRGVSGHCGAYAALGYDTAHPDYTSIEEQEEEMSERG